jgi:hypothetical protein
MRLEIVRGIIVLESCLKIREEMIKVVVRIKENYKVECLKEET